LLGRKPWEYSRKVGSNILFKIIFNPAWTILSLAEAIVRGLALSICIRLPALNWNFSVVNLSDRFRKKDQSIPSKVSVLTPKKKGVMFPGLFVRLL